MNLCDAIGVGSISRVTSIKFSKQTTSSSFKSRFFNDALNGNG